MISDREGSTYLGPLFFGFVRETDLVKPSWTSGALGPELSLSVFTLASTISFEQVHIRNQDRTVEFVFVAGERKMRPLAPQLASIFVAKDWRIFEMSWLSLGNYSRCLTLRHSS